MPLSNTICDHLILVQNGDDSDDDLESERDIEYIPENATPQSRLRARKCDELCLSIMLIDEGLASDGLAAQYDVSDACQTRFKHDDLYYIFSFAAIISI